MDLSHNSSFTPDGVQFAWDSTSLKLWQECSYKYYLTMIEGWQGRGLSAHLRFGSVYAKALEHFHKFVAAGESREDALCAVVNEALILTWEHDCDEHGRIAGTGAPWQSDHHIKTRENLIRTIVWYIDHYWNDNMTTYITASGQAAVEFSFSLPVDNGIVFCGHIDRLVEYRDQIMVQDQKTTGSTISQYYFDQYSPDTQMSMYTFAGQMIYKTKVAGVVIDAAQIAVGFSRFDRGLTYRTPGQLDEWFDDSMKHIEAAQQATRNREFPMNTTSCGNYGGCAFRRVCARAPEVRGNFLDGDFEKTRMWDPLKRR